MDRMLNAGTRSSRARLPVADVHGRRRRNQAAHVRHGRRTRAASEQKNRSKLVQPNTPVVCRQLATKSPHNKADSGARFQGGHAAARGQDLSPESSRLPAAPKTAETRQPGARREDAPGNYAIPKFHALNGVPEWVELIIIYPKRSLLRQFSLSGPAKPRLSGSVPLTGGTCLLEPQF
jgi:hypothetical protein